MGRIIRNGIEYGSGNENATNINYDNSLSGLEATTVQEAVDELTDSLEKIDTYDLLVSSFELEKAKEMEKTLAHNINNYRGIMLFASNASNGNKVINFYIPVSLFKLLPRQLASYTNLNGTTYLGAFLTYINDNTVKFSNASNSSGNLFDIELYGVY